MMPGDTAFTNVKIKLSPFVMDDLGIHPDNVLCAYQRTARERKKTEGRPGCEVGRCFEPRAGPDRDQRIHPPAEHEQPASPSGWMMLRRREVL